jgi:hypothetical protein
MTPQAAEDHMRAARVQAEMIKQGSMFDAMRLPEPQQSSAIRAAEVGYCLALARAAEETGVVDANFYHASAKLHGS